MNNVTLSKLLKGLDKVYVYIRYVDLMSTFNKKEEEFSLLANKICDKRYVANNNLKSISGHCTVFSFTK